MLMLGFKLALKSLYQLKLFLSEFKTYQKKSSSKSSSKSNKKIRKISMRIIKRTFIR